MIMFRISVLAAVYLGITICAIEPEAPSFLQGDNTTGIVALSDADVNTIAKDNHTTAILGLEIDNETSTKPLPVIPLLIMVQPLINATKKGRNHTAMKSTKPKKYYYFQLNTTESQPVPFITPVDFLNHTNYSQLGSQNLTNVTAGPHVHHSHRNKTHKLFPLQPKPPSTLSPPATVNPSSLSLRLQNCTDIPPSQAFTCQQQKAFGKCDVDFMVKYNYCARTCFRAPCPQCSDIQPPGNDFTCEQQKAFGKCNAEWMVSGAYCAQTCQVC